MHFHDSSDTLPDRYNDCEPSLKIETRWLFLSALTLGAAGGAVVAWRARHRRDIATHALDAKSRLTSWENEGGNLAPEPATTASP